MSNEHVRISCHVRISAAATQFSALHIPRQGRPFYPPCLSLVGRPAVAGPASLLSAPTTTVLKHRQGRACWNGPSRRRGGGTRGAFVWCGGRGRTPSSVPPCLSLVPPPRLGGEWGNNERTGGERWREEGVLPDGGQHQLQRQLPEARIKMGRDAHTGDQRALPP